MTTQFNSDDVTVLNNAANSICVTTSWATGGGIHAPVGDAVLNTGFPLTSGATRTPMWTNIQSIYAKQLSLESTINSLVTTISGLVATVQMMESQLDSLTSDPADTGDGNPVVAAVKWANAHP